MKHLSFWLAILLALYVYARLNRYQFILEPGSENVSSSFIVFDRWTTRVDLSRATKEHFVAEPILRP